MITQIFNFVMYNKLNIESTDGYVFYDLENTS